MFIRLEENVHSTRYVYVPFVQDVYMHVYVCTVQYSTVLVCELEQQ